MQLINEFVFLCAIDIFSKCTWIFPLKDEKGMAVTNAFQKTQTNQTKYEIDKVMAAG